MIHPICTMKDGTEVYVDLIRSTAAQAIARQPQLVTLLKEALLSKKLLDPEFTLEYDVGRVIGQDLIVDALNEDAIFYAREIHNDAYTRFIKLSKPPATNYVSAVLRRAANGHYELCDVRIGRLALPRPGSANETPDSRAYWERHAFVYNGQALQPRTVTKLRPY